MSIATLQAQIKQLRAQLKSNQSPEQSRILTETITHLEKKITEAQQKNESKAPKLEIIPNAIPKTSKRVTAQALPTEKPTEPPKTQSDLQELGDATKSKQPNEQKLANGRTLKAAPGQGQHQLLWHIKGVLQHKDSQFTFTLADSNLSIPISVYKSRQKALLTILPTIRYCSIYPIIKNGIIVKGQLSNWNQEEGEEELLVQGFWIPEDQKLLIQSDFKMWKAHSRNRYHDLPVAEGVNIPSKGFKAFQLTRERLSLHITGEQEIRDLRQPHKSSKSL